MRGWLSILAFIVVFFAGALRAHAQSSQAIDAPITYTASDSIVLTKGGTAHLHGKGDMKYKNLNLTSEYIRVQMDSSTVYAVGVYDSITDDIVGQPVFKEGETSYESKEMSYNLRTHKAYIRNVVTEQGEGYIIADKTKKMEGDEMMMGGARYTTCSDHEHPHFYLQLTKAKAKPGEYVATGPAYLVVGDVPLPIALPFGFFPFTSTYSSGLIMPQFGENSQRGLYVQGLGYYFAINDYLDFEVTGDIYTRGTWAVRAASKYRKRYKFSGAINLSYRNDVTGEKDMPNYTKATNFAINWTHSQDTKANPYSTFSASVNFSTSGYNRSNINNYYNPTVQSENTKSSTINYTQRFPGSQWSIGLNASIQQRTADSTISLTLPSLTINMGSVYPFKRKKAKGSEKWYEKIKLTYSGNGSISVTDKENHLLHSNFGSDWRKSFNHKLGASASFTLFKYLNITPNINYNERWYFQRVDKSWDEAESTVVNDTTVGFYRVWDLTASLSLSTKLYGFYIPSRKLFPNSKVDRFRHVLTPSLSLNYSPDCESIRAKLGHNYYDSYEQLITQADGTVVSKMVEYNRFPGYSVPGKGNVGSLSFSLGNNLEMKVVNKADTTGKDPWKVVSLIDNFSISGNYNFMADSMNWSNFNTNLRIKLPKPLNYTINLSGQWDPYLYSLNEAGNPVRTNRRCWQEGKFLHFKGTSTSFSYTFNNETFKRWFGKLDEKKKDAAGGLPDFDPDDAYAMNPETGEVWSQEERDAKRAELQERSHTKEDAGADGYILTEIPWSLSISYTLRYGESNIFDYEKMNYKMQFTHNLSFSASLGLGRGWRASTSTSYDFKAKKFSTMAINITRDLHCWSMSANVVPFGPWKSYTFHIGVNAGMLSDLKYDKSSSAATNRHTDWW